MVWHILRHDLQQLSRDRSLFVFLLMPFLIIPLMRWGWPWLTEMMPAWEAWGAQLTVLMGMVLALCPALIWGLPMLAEKTGGIWSVWQASPLAFGKWMGIRLSFLTGMSAIFILGLFLGTNEIALPIARLLLLLIGMSVFAPLSTLIMLAWAHNQVEGLSLFKLMNILLFLPLAAQWLQLDGLWLRVLPAYALYELADMAKPLDWEVWTQWAGSFTGWLLLSGWRMWQEWGRS